MSQKTAAILTIGDELLEGRTVDTNAAYLGASLSDLGWRVITIQTVGDDEAAIADRVIALVRAADILLVTGGLGPTPDDLTREGLARAACVDLIQDLALAAEIKKRAQGRAQVANARQARLPKGARVLKNPIGTAPGFVVTVSDCDVVVMPGVPVELQRMFRDQVEPVLRGNAPGKVYFTKVFGMREAVLAETLGDLLSRAGQPRVGVTATSGVLTVRVQGKGAEDRAREIRKRIGDHVYAEADVSLADVVVASLKERSESVAAAESLTGGALSAAIVAVPGASAVFAGGLTAYSKEQKQSQLGLEAGLLSGGAVQGVVAIEMARSVREKFGTSWGVATTGVAGPDPDADGAPVGLVFLAVAGPDGKLATKTLDLPGGRSFIRQRAVNAALDLLRRAL